MTAALEIIQLGNPILRQVAQPIDVASAEWVSKLIDQMMVSLTRSNGVGIAAPQVGQSYRLLIVASRPNPRYPNAPEMQPTVMINPQMLDHSEEQVKGWEGCLSVPGLRGYVPRYREVEVEYTTPTGTVKRQQFSDFVARIFQHELDHLEGLVFLDRLQSTHDLMTEQEYLKGIDSCLQTQ